MRSEEEMFDLISGVARSDERIRAVVLNGSRANPKAMRDEFQDYDVVYFVRDIESFTRTHDWIDVFGERIILQMPDDMRLPGEEIRTEKTSFAYLMLFKDHNRIDLTLLPIDGIGERFKLSSLSVVLLDKDAILPALPPASDKDHLIRKPSEKEFRDVCNEFWWVLPYVAKGLRRGEITYAKDFLEGTVRKMFVKIIEWRIGVETGFSVNFGQSGKFLPQYMNAAVYEEIKQTYPDARSENIWNSVFKMTEIFENSAKLVAAQLGFDYNVEESANVIEYLKVVKKGDKKKGETNRKN